MKVVKAHEMGRIEKLAYADGASELAFMENAGRAVAGLAQHLIGLYHLNPKIALICGSGNNAGDAYVAGRILIEGGFQVHAISCALYDKSSPLCQKESQRFIACGGRIEYITHEESISFSEAELLIDGLLGTGFHGEVSGLMKTLIERANDSSLPILSVDIPSGVDGNTGQFATAIKARDTLFLGLPKSGCFIGEAWSQTGRVHTHNFGLKAHYIEEAHEEYHLIDQKFVKNAMPKISRTRHKYQAGYVIGIGGSKGMPGAPLMACLSALRSGAGIVRLLHPEGMEAELSHAPFEIIRQGYPVDSFTTIMQAMERGAAVFVGPGIGVSESASFMLRSILAGMEKPCVIDAEALTLIAAHDLPFPKQTIITPHHGEMARLLKAEKNIPPAQLLEKTAAYAQKHKITVVLKGAPTFIFHPDRKPYVTASGDPGMATAGSGDVLTGMVAALLAQAHDPFKAAALAVELHARAGEYAARTWSSYCMKACDIIDALPLAFKSVSHQ